MILLDDVVEVSATPHPNVLPPWILSAQKAQRLMARCVTVKGIFRGPTWSGQVADSPRYGRTRHSVA